MRLALLSAATLALSLAGGAAFAQSAASNTGELDRPRMSAPNAYESNIGPMEGSRSAYNARSFNSDRDLTYSRCANSVSLRDEFCESMRYLR